MCLNSPTAQPFLVMLNRDEAMMGFTCNSPHQTRIAQASSKSPPSSRRQSSRLSILLAYIRLLPVEIDLR